MSKIDEAKQQLINDFILFKALKSNEYKNKCLDGLKELRKYYGILRIEKVSKISDFYALYMILDWSNPAREIVNQIYSQL